MGSKASLRFGVSLIQHLRQARYARHMTYASLRLQSEPVDAFRRLARQLAAEADRDLSLSEVLALVLGVASEHRAELVERARGGLTGAPQTRNPGAGTSPVQPSEPGHPGDGGNRS